MSKLTMGGGIATLGLMAALAVAVPAAAAPVTTGAAGLAAISSQDTVQIRYERKKKHTKKRAYRRAGPVYAHQPYDNVGSIVYDGVGYGYNRLTGQRYMSCMFDEGYGRVKPCDAGGGGGGRN